MFTYVKCAMATTIKRTIVILILLAIVFFIYRGISPSGADRLLLHIKNIPVRLGLLSGELISSPIVSSWSIVSHTLSTGEALVFSSSLASGWLFALEALVIPPQNTTTTIEPITTGWSLTIVPTTGETTISPVVTKPTPAPAVATQESSSSRITAQDYALLNNLFK